MAECPITTVHSTELGHSALQPRTLLSALRHQRDAQPIPSHLHAISLVPPTCLSPPTSAIATAGARGRAVLA